ncbi:bacillopeptidase F [Folsomia candida]|uniref:bacillopeptidase F n=1 Tax=Folsomia candida TaxID=158441 RepID=UPI000B9077A4|nr:bacillopeptidase F [Folsomia candida]
MSVNTNLVFLLYYFGKRVADFVQIFIDDDQDEKNLEVLVCVRLIFLIGDTSIIIIIRRPQHQVLNRISNPILDFKRYRIEANDLKAIQTLGSLPIGVFNIREQLIARVEPVDASVTPSSSQTSAIPAIQWGVEKIGAPAVWARTKGEGIVVANIDTGVFGGHESLRDNYGGKWYDATGESNLTTPNDGNRHGTSTMGMLCGRPKGIGVAPNVKWIACKAIGANGGGSEGNMKKCAQWIFQQRPHVVSNSWVFGRGATNFNDIISSWRAVGIIPVFAIGNEGDRCRSAGSPGDQTNVISVGSTRSNDTLSTFSARGFAVNGAIKPEVTAPGEEIYTAWYSQNDKPYLYYVTSGTSSATPHVAGAIALMLSANPSWTFDQVFNALTRTADRPPVDAKDLACGNTTTSNYPNNGYGFGRINVQRALGM